MNISINWAKVWLKEWVFYFTEYNKYLLLMNSTHYMKYDFKLFTVHGRNLMFLMNLLCNQYKTITRKEVYNYTWLTFLLVQSWFGPYAGTTVHTWPLFLTTVFKVLIREDFPDALYPITQRLRAWLCSGIIISSMSFRSWSFFFNWRRKKSL